MTSYNLIGRFFLERCTQKNQKPKSCHEWVDGSKDIRSAVQRHDDIYPHNLICEITSHSSVRPQQVQFNKSNTLTHS